ncbi:MAG: 16S rRNA processing protein RimM [Bacteroidia bacterium]|nr:16S rRNA processing protein RimM [Bacteroidia bacterium]
MIKKEEVYKIGIFNKPHGIHGELQFTFTDDIFDRVDCNYVICLLDGILVPFFIQECRFRSDSSALIKLEGIETTERARLFTNTEVYFPVKYAQEVPQKQLSWSFFIDFEVEDTEGCVIGKITEIDTSTINTLLVIDCEGDEILIPAQEEFVAGVDTEERVLVLNLPEGLLDFDEAENDWDEADDEENANLPTFATDSQ